MHNEEATTPLTYQEAVSAPDIKQWKNAMDEEMEQIEEKKTWKLVKLPEGARVVKNKWVYFYKKDAEGRLKRRRARLVAKGFTQQKGVDYDEVFAPVAKYSTVRMMLAFAAQEHLEMLLLDVKAAFLNVKLYEKILMDQPEGYIVKGVVSKGGYSDTVSGRTTSALCKEEWPSVALMLTSACTVVVGYSMAFWALPTC